MGIFDKKDEYQDFCKELDEIDQKPIYEQQELLVLSGRTGNLYLTERLLARGHPVDTTDMHSMTPLHWAVYQNNASMVSFLINRGADPNAFSPESYDSPVSLAAKNGNVPILDFLLRHGGNIHYHDSRGVTLLMCAAASGSPLTCEYLVCIFIFSIFALLFFKINLNQYFIVHVFSYAKVPNSHETIISKLLSIGLCTKAILWCCLYLFVHFLSTLTTRMIKVSLHFTLPSGETKPFALAFS